MGLDNGIIVKTTLRSGRTLECEICYWRKHWGLRDKILSIIDPKEEKFEYTINKGDLKEIKDLLIDVCENEDSIDECKSYYSDITSFIELGYRSAGAIQAVLMFIDKKIKWYNFYDAYGDEDFTEETDFTDTVEKIEIKFYDSY